MDLNKLRTFCEVARLGSISLAAESLRRTQPAITQQIKILEAELELSLLDRRSGRVFLTLEGDRLYTSAREKFRSLEDDLAEIKGDAEAIQGLIRIGVYAHMGQMYLAPLIEGFRQRYSGARFQIVEGDDREVEARLTENEIDIGFLFLFQSKRLFEIVPVLKGQMLLLASKDYVRRSGPITTFEKVLKQDLIVRNEEFGGLGLLFAGHARKLLPELRRQKPVAIAEDGNLVRELVMRGVGIAMLPVFEIEEEIRSGELVPIMNRGKPFRIQMDAAVKRRRNFGLVHQKFFEFVRDNPVNT